MPREEVRATVVSIVRKIDEANELAKSAFVTGDRVAGAAALALAAQLLQLARIWERME